MRELLLEIGCEEIPASWLPSLTGQLGDQFGAQLRAARLDFEDQIRTFSTPRRLGLFVPGVAARQTDLEETVTGPPVTAAFGADGAPTRAAEGFARKHGVSVSALETIETGKGAYLAYQRRQRGRTARQVLPVVLSATLRALAFPKQMHWDAWLDDGHGELVFGRPIRWLVFLHGRQVVPFTIERSKEAQSPGVQPVKAGAVTFGHRFFAKAGNPGRPIRVRSFADYKTGLERGYVLIDRDVRRDRVADKLQRFATRLGGRVALGGDESALLGEVPDLVEYPSVVTGSFPSEFLSLPDEVLTTTMVHHQHYFPVARGNGKLMPHFLAVTNTPRDNVSRIARNAGRVLVARLRDARFFWDADRRTSLTDQLPRLDTLLFHKSLGSYRAKAERVAALAERLVVEVLGVPEMAAAARTAGLLCKADLATDMVGEFPELQGVMGGVYAREQGEPEEVWRAIYHHYLPIGIEPTAPPARRALGRAAVTWAAVSLADKLDTLAGLFHAGEHPTGSRDPFGIRRQAQGVVRVLVDLPELTGLMDRISVGQVLDLASEPYGKVAPDVATRRTDFVRERTRYLLEERGYDIRNVRSVTHQRSLADLCPLDARRKLEALPVLSGTADFQQLATLFKRVKNIAREISDADYRSAEEASDQPLEPLLTEPAEKALLAELERRQPVIEQAVRTGEGYRQAFGEASRFGPAVDRFFTDVFVMVEDAALRRARLRLMKRLERLILQLADVSEIVQMEETPPAR